METIIFQLRSGPLAAMLMNALVFAYPPMDLILFTVRKGKLTIVSTDGFVALKDECDVSGSDEMTAMVHIDQVKELYGMVKAVKDLKTRPGWLDIMSNGYMLTAREVATGEEISVDMLDVHISGLKMEQLLEFFDRFDEVETLPTVPVAIHAERLRDVARIKIHGNSDVAKIAPLDIRMVKNPFKDQSVMAVKYGPTARMMIAGIDRERSGNTLEQYESGSSEKCLWK